MDIASAVSKLNALLPLTARQKQLPPEIRQLHQKIMHSLSDRGLLDTGELAAMLETFSIDQALQRLSDADLIVLDDTGMYPVGAYPLTLQDTPHKVHFSHHSLYAMCALDAVSVAPLFDQEILINSCCHITKTPIFIHMSGNRVLDAKPSHELMLGIRWQQPGHIAAHSLCLEMVFLEDVVTARSWQDQDSQSISLFSLSESIEFGKSYFEPLLL
jgi:mercuric reductase